MKRIYAILLISALCASGAQAQQKNDLQKQVELDKKFEPVKKKVTKKNALPEVKQPSSTTGDKRPSTLDYANWNAPAETEVSIPTMYPYGYRTLHNFSDRRGYFDFGIGTQLNTVASLGYRIIDDEVTTLGAWFQHNSTWTGENTTKWHGNPADHQIEFVKQKFNDNLVGVDLSRAFTGGTLTASARLEIDNFNYYGGLNQYTLDVLRQGTESTPSTYTFVADWDDFKNTFINIELAGGWKGKPFYLGEKTVDYKANLKLGHAGYSNAFCVSQPDIDGVKKNTAKLSLSGAYNLAEDSQIGLDLIGDFISAKRYPFDGYEFGRKISKDYGMLTVAPSYSFSNDVLSATLGAVMNVSFNDGAKLRLAPNVDINIDIASGAVLFAEATGGKTINGLAAVHHANRYSDPTASYRNSYTPLDVMAGFKIGSYGGFTAKVFAEYSMTKGDLCACLVTPYNVYQFMTDTQMGYQFMTDTQMGYLASNVSMPWNRYAATLYKNLDFKGYIVGADVNYKYRSLVEVNAGLRYAPSDDDIYADKYSTGLGMGLDGAGFTAELGVKVTPIKPLDITAGFEYRTDRCVIEQIAADSYQYADLENMTNLRVGAKYRFDRMLTLWIEGNNLLNKRYDFLPGMGAQRLSIMGGVGLVF